MFKFFYNSFIFSFISILIFTILFSFFQIPIRKDFSSYGIDEKDIHISPQGFYWPLPGKSYISSYFGKRVSPTTGASTYHAGVDIPAPDGTYFLAVTDGEVIYTGFKGGGGYTITFKNDIYTISYCHVNPNFIVSVGDFINSGDVIGQVGPKNVYDVLNNPYKDSLGNPTNGATTGSHLHISIKKDGIAVNPLDYISID